jgi:hypothetical protein
MKSAHAQGFSCTFSIGTGQFTCSDADGEAFIGCASVHV